MVDLNPELLTIIMLGGVFVGVLTGFPLAIIVGALAMVIGFLVMGPNVGTLLEQRAFKIETNYILLAVPLFVFMGNMLERSGIT